MAKITYFVNGSNFGKATFERTLRDLKYKQEEFSIENKYYWDAGVYKQLKDLVYGEYQLTSIKRV